jgi:hypothetical protein
MTDVVSRLTRLLLKVGIAAFVANEVRGLILAGPVFYAMYEAGGAWMAMWLGVSALGGIAISVLAPVWLAKKLKLLSVRLA